MMRSVLSMPASVKAFSKTRFCESVSTVEPDFDETIIAVLERSPAKALPTWSALVESRTTSSTFDVRVITSGASDEPPIPQSTKRLTPLARKYSRRARISATNGCESVAELTHPRRIEDSASASLPQSVKSLAAIRLATLSATSVEMLLATAAAAEPPTTTFKEDIFSLLGCFECRSY